ncbi:hypothetical protein C1645_824498 [Glomus cerebriforme]|uniref:Uncharacterized protein n=1 Tax=Glomus cerebriforme TaxID=658196 RepID=A0A397SUA1_9GLOM|nr:hypothetical protein C1645_824498 [Glomus cerebriforme]
MDTNNDSFLYYSHFINKKYTIFTKINVEIQEKQQTELPEIQQQAKEVEPSKKIKVQSLDIGLYTVLLPLLINGFIVGKEYKLPKMDFPFKISEECDNSREINKKTYEHSNVHLFNQYMDDIHAFIDEYDYNRKDMMNGN